MVKQQNSNTYSGCTVHPRSLHVIVEPWNSEKSNQGPPDFPAFEYRKNQILDSSGFFVTKSSSKGKTNVHSTS